MQPPHCFPSLVEPEMAARPVLIIGTGMSKGIAPMPDELCKEIAVQQEVVESALGCVTDYPLSGKGPELYIWAGHVIQRLMGYGITQVEAKRKLANAIGVTNDPRFRARVGIPLRGNTPRHRVVARFAREGRWGAVWSLNWDVILESALESVGLMPCPKGNQSPKLPKDWPEWYATWTQPEPYIPLNKTLMIIKPHGCVLKLLHGNSTFLITNNELSKISADLSTQGALLQAHFTHKPLVAVGWSANEEYIHETIKPFAQAKVLGIDGQVDSLSIIDPYPNEEGHSKLVEAYAVSRESAFVRVQEEECYTTDQLFVWMQTRHGLLSLIQALGPGANAVAAKLQAILEKFTEPNCKAWINTWFDDFLPVWVRLCFKAGAMVFYRGVPVDVRVVPTHRRDEHIPWGDGNVKRPDLQAASRLLSAMLEVGSEWDVSEFPGGLWDMESRHLILPLPAWKRGEPLSLAALKPLAEGRHWERRGEIKCVSILPVLPDVANVVLDGNTVTAWKQQVAGLMGTAHLAQAEHIKLANLEALRRAT